MTPEELLKPRYKVIADYPDSIFVVGKVIELTIDNVNKVWSYHHFTEQCSELWDAEYFDEYPHLFKKLSWWEDRKPEDRPVYVKCIKTPDQLHFPGMVNKISWKSGQFGFDENGSHIHLYTNCYEPATLEEYNVYINNK